MKPASFAGVILLLMSCSALSDTLPVPTNALYPEECGGCHVAYPPKLLTGDNWQQIMNGLDRHFGSDASIDAQSKQEITAFLLRHASSDPRHRATSLRIHDTPWFIKKHHRLKPRAYTNASVKSPANCTACHAQAEQGVWHSPPHSRMRTFMDYFTNDDD
ncbi:MAG: diheme cytochrome c [Gallionellaceae bacterium]|jgi:hypothetical protein|nr:diheme cytochrome c [Gallionellaceae bacterium]